MSEQMIIAVSREFASGGHLIAEILAEKFQLPLLDKNLLKEIALERDLNLRNLEKYDEDPRKQFWSRTVNGYSNSPEENIANLQFDYLKKKADAGESFVVVGRCASTVLKENPALISIFVLGDWEEKVKRVMENDGYTKMEAELYIKRENKKRKNYHNYYSDLKWGDSRNYDLTVNDSRMGIAETADFLEMYIRMRRGERMY